MNGFEGLKKAEEEKPDLIITDIMMPIMDGIRLFNKLKKSPDCHSTPVIAITSFKGSITNKSLLNMGFKGVVSKPLDKKEIHEVIHKVLDETKQNEFQTVR
ncbi:Phosphate regulon transcriptional regulatory protein PhoB (SphR) [Chitinispirillum alkaliphilum]|nr:Phosphate regulon transcriptional regulatory protein PhoB (SphR) [Chitinispirillum alkaliphilum]